MSENRMSAELTAADKQAILEAIATIENKLPFLTALSKDERVSMLKLGDKSRSFVLKTMELVSQNDRFLPRSFEVEEMRKDVALFSELYGLSVALTQLLEKIEDTMMIAGSEAYAAALVAYKYAKDAGEDEGLTAVVDDIGKRFVRRYAKTEKAEGSL
ncbi:MAG: hypothetical protein HC918_11575 [Oscillatoriales cyanobacterium SM2_1_8]|nr:hypothetical protein [Oscillatoriales cyanobacterium SM2_1_8]